MWPTSGGRLARVDVADNDDVNVDLLFTALRECVSDTGPRIEVEYLIRWLIEDDLPHVGFFFARRLCVVFGMGEILRAM